MRTLKTILFVLLFTGAAFAQGGTSKVRSVTSLPGTCNPGNGVVPADEVVLVSGGASTLEICSASNTWSTVGSLPLVGSPVNTTANGVTSWNVFGDSIALAVGTELGSTQGYAPLVVSALGATVANNFGVGGVKIETIVGQAYAVTPSASVGSIAILGANDLTNATPTADYAKGITAYATWLALQPAQIKKVAAITFVGSWSNQTYANLAAKFSTTAGDTATATVNGTTVYVGMVEFHTINSSFTINIDGTTVYTAATETVARDNFPVGFRFSGLSAGNHTVQISPTVNSQFAVVQWIGGNGGGSGSLPLNVIGATLQNQSTSFDATRATMNANTSSLMTNLASDGLNVIYVDDSSTLSISASPAEYAPSLVHPNFLGNWLLANKFLGQLYNPTAQTNNLTTQFLVSMIGTHMARQDVTVPIFNVSATSNGEIGQLAVPSVGASSNLNIDTAINSWSSIPIQPFGWGSPGIYSTTVSLTGQTAAKTSTLLYAVPSTSAGLYRITAYAKITTASDGSSTLGGSTGFQLTWTDPTDSTTPTVTFSDQSSQSLTGNTTTTMYSTTAVIQAKASTNINYAFGYTDSHTTTAMAYKLVVKLEYLGN